MNESDARHDDEIVSAYLDGEATADERVRVENDPRLQARLVELRQVAAAVGTPHFFADSPGRDTLIARALAAGGAAAPADDTPPGSAAQVVDLDAVRRRRRLTVLSAAAAVLVVLLAVPLLSRDRGSRLDQTASPATEARSGALGDDTTAEMSDVAGAVTTTPAAVVPPPDSGAPTTLAPPPSNPVVPDRNLTVDDLGSFTTRGEAQLAVSDAIDRTLEQDALTGTTEAAALLGASAECDERIRSGDDELLEPIFAATFDLDGETHLVVVYRLAPTGDVNGTHRIYEMAVPACTQVSVATISR